MRVIGAIGLTGNIASGKSTVSRHLAETGAAILDADAIYDELIQPGKAGWLAVCAAFGDGVLTPEGGIDRRRLGEIVFGDGEKLAQLNRLTHPLVREEIAGRIGALREARRFPIIVDAPLLYEAGCDALVDEVWFVWCADAVRVRRLMARNGLAEAEAWRRVRAQGAQDAKARRADRILYNREGVEALLAQADSALAAYRARFGGAA